MSAATPQSTPSGRATGRWPQEAKRIGLLAFRRAVCYMMRSATGQYQQGLQRGLCQRPVDSSRTVVRPAGRRAQTQTPAAASQYPRSPVLCGATNRLAVVDGGAHPGQCRDRRWMASRIDTRGRPRPEPRAEQSRAFWKRWRGKPGWGRTYMGMRTPACSPSAPRWCRRRGGYSAASPVSPLRMRMAPPTS
jgi:hypothetical protein